MYGKVLKGVLLIVVVLIECAPIVRAQPLPDREIAEVGPDSFLVAFETSKGSFDVKAYRSWSPLASDRFYHLVRLGYYDDVSIFRMVSGYVAQFGIQNQRHVNDAWRPLGLPDEAVRASNARGTISFARGGPRTRTTQLFINLRDNQQLDTMPIGGVVGYPPFAQVISGMEVVDSFNGQYGNVPSTRQDSINISGRAFLDRVFPGLDYIKSAKIVATYGE